MAKLCVGFLHAKLYAKSSKEKAMLCIEATKQYIAESKHLSLDNSELVVKD